MKANIERVRFPSLETRWLQRAEKWLPQADVFFVQEALSGPRSEHELLPGSDYYVSLPRGGIVIGHSCNSGASRFDGRDIEPEPGTASVETRHTAG